MKISGNKSWFYAALTVLLWSTVATAFKLALRELDPLQLIFIASGISTLIFLAYLMVSGETQFLFRTGRRELIRSAFLGFLNPFSYYLILFKAYSLLPAQLAQPLNMIWPIILALLSVLLLKQNITWRHFLALGICFAGIVVISSQGNMSGFRNTSITGILLAVGSSFFWSLYWIYNIRDQRPEAVKLFFTFLFGFIYLLILIPFTSRFAFPTGISLWAAVYIGFFEAGITYILWMKALQLSSNNAVTGSMVYVSPFLSLIFISSVLKEKIHVTTLAGLVLIVTGIVLQQIRK